MTLSFIGRTFTERHNLTHVAMDASPSMRGAD
jgi:hypothetical protein